jgi:hypothetical protein
MAFRDAGQSQARSHFATVEIRLRREVNKRAFDILPVVVAKQPGSAQLNFSTSISGRRCRS